MLNIMDDPITKRLLARGYPDWFLQSVHVEEDEDAPMHWMCIAPSMYPLQDSELVQAYAVLKWWHQNQGHRKADIVGETLQSIDYRFTLLEQKKKIDKSIDDRRLGAEKANSKHDADRMKVRTWLDQHYDAQRLRGARHSDIAAEIERLVSREYDTILKDITAWKKERKEKRKR